MLVIFVDIDIIVPLCPQLSTFDCMATHAESLLAQQVMGHMYLLELLDEAQNSECKSRIVACFLTLGLERPV